MDCLRRLVDYYGSLSDLTPMDAPLPIRTTCDAASDPPLSSAGKWNGFTIVRILLGVLLLVAAGLKFTDNGLGSETGFGPFASPTWRLAVTEVEAILGLWLLVGVASHLLWFAALLFFLGLAGTSLYLGMEGQPSCGCFGASLSVSPWHTLGLDLTAVATLVWWRPRREHGIEVAYSVMLRQVLAVIAGSGVVLVAVLGGLAWKYGSPFEALIQARGEPIVVEPSVSQVDEAVAGEKRTFTLRISNHQDRSVRIMGGTTTCSCITTDDLPITVPPNESRPIMVRIRFGGRPGSFQHSFVLYTDDENQQTVTASFTGRVIESPSPYSVGK